MAAIPGLPQKFTGRRMTAAKVTGLTINITTGALTLGSTFNLASASLDSIDAMTFSPSLDNEEMSGASTGMRNHVPIKGDFEVEVREIKSANGGSVSLGTAYNFTYFLAEMITTDGTTPQLEQAVCLFAGLEDEYSEGKSINVLRGVSCGYPIYVGDPTTPLYHA